MTHRKTKSQKGWGPRLVTADEIRRQGPSWLDSVEVRPEVQGLAAASLHYELGTEVPADKIPQGLTTSKWERS